MSNCGAGQIIREQALTDRGVARYCWNDTTRMLDGPFRQYYASGSLRWAGSFRQGRRDGDWMAFHPNGRLAQASHYVNGALEGPLAMWTLAGTARALRHYRADAACGLAVEWNDSGAEIYRREYASCAPSSAPPPMASPVACGSDMRVGSPFPAGRAQWCERDGVRAGPFVSWYADGVVHERSTWSDGALDGAFERFHPDSASAERGSYRAGQRDGMWSSAWEDGAAQEIGSWRAGVRDGLHERFRANASPEWSRTWAMGLLEGSSRSYFDNGAIEESASYRMGVFDGLREVFYLSGNPSWRLTYRRGRGEGEYVEWLPDGRLRKRIPYVSDCPSGIGRLYGYPTDDAGVDHEEIEGGFSDCNANDLFRVYIVDRAGRRSFVGEIHYRDGVAQGPFALRYESGRPRVDGQFLAGREDGLWRWYGDADGRPVLGECTYGLGVRISGTCGRGADVPGARPLGGSGL